MRKLLSFISILAVGLAMVSCTSQEAIVNLENVAKVKEGMTKEEVLSIMGKPLENEIYNKPDVWFYYTESKWSDGNRTSDECTPLVFEEGKLIGVGAEFYKKYRQKKW